MTQEVTQPALPTSEFVALMALTISLTALAIDAVLPALPLIASELGATAENAGQYVVTVIFAGFCVGQLIFGPLSDAIGRKPSIYAGIAVFLLGCTVSLLANTFAVMLVGRALQGFGASSLKVVTTAIVRDQYEGPKMARILALILAVFILVPAIAPALGQAVTALFEWRAIFVLLSLHSLVTLIWFGLRQPETLLVADRRSLRIGAIINGVKEVGGNRIALGYTVISGLVFSGMIAYLTSAQQLFQEVYGVGEAFPLYFGGLALSIGAASIANSRLVMTFGMQRLTYGALCTLFGAAALFVAGSLIVESTPPLWLFVAFMLVVFASMGVTFGNFSALAMEPLGHLAGLGAALVGGGSTAISLLLGGTIGQQYNGTVFPLATGFLGIGLVSALLMTWTERSRPAVLGGRSPARRAGPVKR